MQCCRSPYAFVPLEEKLRGEHPVKHVQHRRLVEIINKLSDAMMLKQGYKVICHISSISCQPACSCILQPKKNNAHDELSGDGAGVIQLCRRRSESEKAGNFAGPGC